MDNRFLLPLIAALVRKRCWDAAVTAKTGKLLWFLPNTFKATMKSTLTPSKVFFFFLTEALQRLLVRDVWPSP